MSQGKSNNYTVEETTRIDETSTLDTVYIGYASIGEIGSNAVWKIKKILTTLTTEIKWADGNSEYDNVWDDRTSLTYN